MVKRSPRVIFFYLLLPAIFIIFVYSFMFAKFSNLSHLQVNYRPQVSISNDALRTVGESGLDVSEQLLYYTNASIAKVNTINDYLRLDLNPNDTFWSSKLEQQYQQTIGQSHNKSHGQFPLKVIIVPHSHNDPGWLNTYDQYFYRYTYYILDNLVKNLAKYPNMTFVWPEMSFFSRWWDRLPSEEERRKLKRLLNSARFEIVTGGWIMTDEGPTHYFDMLDQLIEGHQFLRSTLNYSPRNSWSIDPFGHSSTFPYLLQKSGITNIYIQRTHFAWKRQLSETRSLEFFWNQFFQNSSFSNPLLCHMSPLDLYSFKYACGPDSKTCLEFDFRKIYGEYSESTAVPLNATNIDSKAHKIFEQYSKLGSLFPHNVALVLLGDDFRYNFDIEWQQQYTNYEFLMSHVNSNGHKFNNAQISFGTLQDYFSAINERLPITPNNYPQLFGDFMPYADVYVNGVPNYWTGYYTTRPYFKQLSRELQHWLRSAEILYSLARNHLRVHFGTMISTILDKNYSQLSNARQNLALFQHHDGITGTSRSDVIEDYGHRMGHSISNMMELAALSLQMINANNLVRLDHISKPFIFSHLHKPDWSKRTERQILKIPADEYGLKLVIFNPHFQMRTEFIRILVEDPFVNIIDVESNSRVLFQINPVFNGSLLSSTIFELHFIDTFFPLALKNYKVLTTEENIVSKVKIIQIDERPDDENKLNHANEAFQFERLSVPSIENHLMRIDFNQQGLMDAIHFKASNTTQRVEMSFVAYHSEPIESGAYLFKPRRTDPSSKMFSSQVPKYSLFQGKISSTLTVNFSDIQYSVTLYNSQSFIGSAIELKLLVNLEDKSIYNDNEIVIRLKASIQNLMEKSDGQQYRTFYVDSNGFQMLERHFIEEAGVEGNYYPMTTAVLIEDSYSRLTLLSSSSLGVTSPADGTIEVMLDRRIVEDDKRGLSQGITDNLPVELSFWLVLEHSDLPNAPSGYLASLSPLADALLLQLNYPVLVTYSYKNDRELGAKDGMHYFANQYLISPNLFCQYFLLNLRTLPLPTHFSHPSNSTLLLLHNRALSPPRGQDSFQMGQCDTTSSSTVHATNQGLHLFNGLKIETIEATSLTGLHPQQRLYSLSQIEVPSFEINAFNLTFA